MSRSSVEDTEDDDVPLSEVAIPKLHDGTKEEVLHDIRTMAEANPERVISRNYYRVHGQYSESTWSQYFGTWMEAKRQAGIMLTRQQHNLEKQIAKHASVEHYKAMNTERRSYGDTYDKPNSKRFKQVVIVGDLHDRNVDTFYMDVLIDTLDRVKPDIIILNGDIFDLPEFSKYFVDPREWDVVGRIKFVHEQILSRIRKVCPDAQIDFLEGNHEFRLLRHLSDATPALRAVLNDLHGFTVSTLLGLDKYQINYVAKGDLSVYNLTDIHKQISKNYKVYFDSFIVSHDTSAKNLGYPGVNGHHHKTVIDSMYNEHFGAYNWIQSGCGHKLDAEYCHPRWQQGFIIATCDTETRRTVFDTATFSENFAVVGGAYYERKT
jgi:predicted MPP superfamily phosphohydrolase